MFNPHRFENTRPEGFPVMEVVGADTEEAQGESGPRRFVPLRRTELTGEIAGPLAELRLTQEFGYRRADCAGTLEALYRFPLPGDAAVTGVTVRFGEVKIRAELKERQRAESDYEEAIRDGRQAALATRESPDVFTLRVAGLQPDQPVTVETRFVLLARAEAGQWTLRIPLTTAPRYVRSDENGSRHAAGNPLAVLRDPGHRFALNLHFRNAEAIASPTHALEVEEAGDESRVRLRDGDVTPDRDCALTWRSAQQEQQPSLHLLLHEDGAAQQVYFLAQIAPPRRRPQKTLPREIVLLVDHSGSMEGAKWQAADWAVKRFLSDLAPQDTFALGLFHDRTHWFARRLTPAAPDNIAAAIRFLEENHESGGTELGVALEQALDIGRGNGERARHALIVTDAEVTDSGRILTLAERESQREDARRISVLCIDAAPNAFLAHQLAEQGGGVAKFLTSDPQEEDIATALDALLEDWSAPILTGLRLEINREGAQVTGKRTVGKKQAGGSAIDLGDLPAGRALWVAGRAPRGDSPDLAFRVVASGGGEIAARRCDLESAAPHPAIKALFGARRVLGLEHLITGASRDRELHRHLERLGYDGDAILSGPAPEAKVYAENARRDTEEALRELLVKEALDYGLASAETAFVAVRSEAGKRIEASVIVANALPHGWSGGFAAASGMHVMYSMAAPSVGQMDFAMPGYSDADILACPPSPGGYVAGAGSAGGLRGMAQRLFSRSRAPKRAKIAMPQEPMLEESKENAVAPLFAGQPVFSGGEAVLFDTANGGSLPEETTFTRLEIGFPDGTPDAAALDPGLTLLLYVEDMASPRARVRLTDLIRQGGMRPLNIHRGRGQAVRLVLADPAGVWQQNAPSLEVRLM